MAQLFTLNQDNDWETLTLESDIVEIHVDCDDGSLSFEAQATNHEDAPNVGTGVARLQREQFSGREQWILMATNEPRLWINGLPLRTGVRLLRDRDEIRLSGSRRFHFSNERLARPEPFRPEGDPDTSSECACARCRQPIAFGTPAVQCPGCKVWYHQMDTLNCWTYVEKCALCDQNTDLEAGYRWTPGAN